jgi:hypothetical protein
VFTTPDSIDRKAQTKSAAIDKEEERRKEKLMVQQALATSAAKNRTEAHLNKRNGMVGSRDQRVPRMNGMLNASVNPSTVDEEARMFNAHRMSSTGNFINGELYSRVVAPPASRSSSSSSSSESTASYESSKAMPSSKCERPLNNESSSLLYPGFQFFRRFDFAEGADNHPNSNSFWHAWSNDTLYRGGVIPTTFKEYGSNRVCFVCCL